MVRCEIGASAAVPSPRLKMVAESPIQCSRRLLREPKLFASSPSHTPGPDNLELIDELATDQLRVAYSSSVRTERGAVPQARDEVFRWVAPN